MRGHIVSVQEFECELCGVYDSKQSALRPSSPPPLSPGSDDTVSSVFANNVINVRNIEMANKTYYTLQMCLGVHVSIHTTSYYIGQ